MGMPAFDHPVSNALKARKIPRRRTGHRQRRQTGNGSPGYGLANTKTQEPVSLETLFSTASVTKTVTTAAVLRLVDQGKLSLDEPVYTLLGKPSPLGSAKLDPLAEKIAVRRLLLHAAGWNSKLHVDVLLQRGRIHGPLASVSLVGGDGDSLWPSPGRWTSCPAVRACHNSNFGYFPGGRSGPTGRAAAV